MAMLICVGGLGGTGKSWLSEAVAKNIGAEILRTDVVRKELVGLKPTERAFSAYEKGIYSAEMSDRTYTEILKRAGKFLKKGKNVILDASFRKQKHRDEAHTFAKKLDVKFYFLECTASDSVVKKRLKLRLAENKDASDLKWGVYQEMKQHYEPVKLPKTVYARIDRDAEIDASVHQALEFLKV